MNNFVVDIDRRAIGFQRQFHDIHGAHHTGAKATGSHPEQDFPIFWILHGHPSLTERQRTLSYPSSSPERIRFAALGITQAGGFATARGALREKSGSFWAGARGRRKKRESLAVTSKLYRFRAIYSVFSI